MKSNLPSYEQKNTGDTLDNLSEYDKSKIEKYQSEIEDGILTIQQDPELKSLDFIRLLQLNELVLIQCRNIIPKLESSNIKKIKIGGCFIQGVKDFQLENLEVLWVNNNFEQLESQMLVQEILQFKKLKELELFNWIIDISPLSQMIRLTKLSLIECELSSTEVLRPLVHLEELCLDGNKVEITTLQYLTKITYLQLVSCNLVNLDALRPLKKLEKLDIVDNQIVYLQPLMELKQLSRLYTRFNKIKDIESIQLHPNFDNFNLDENQELPTNDELEVANILRDINSPITSLKQIYEKSSRIINQNILFRQKINQQLQHSYKSHEQFVVRVALLFQKINAFDGQ
ncbi:leucine-rich_repeat domain-containing protein [Hexamita inflata]|uniref:Leucine-rich repeat domain-containing protein n=1 Tax=Hexamita inflata TaxID=28002 RepID=A0AA86UT64_9EUKA|nr:leucine-rich repeat domain-containing protein [Hexamita inflata]